MTNVFGYFFSEPYPLGTNFRDFPAVYAIYTSEQWLDVGETETLGTRINGHERRPCWISHSNGRPIWIVYLSLDSQDERLEIESYLRTNMNPWCGEK